jgi:hypothetical protein
MGKRLMTMEAFAIALMVSQPFHVGDSAQWDDLNCRRFRIER